MPPETRAWLVAKCNFLRAGNCDRVVEGDELLNRNILHAAGSARDPKPFHSGTRNSFCRLADFV